MYQLVNVFMSWESFAINMSIDDDSNRHPKALKGGLLADGL